MDGTCGIFCPGGTYAINLNNPNAIRSCALCHPTCDWCAQDPAVDKCTTCKGGLFQSSDSSTFSCLDVCPPTFFAAQGNICRSCHPSCATCSGPEIDKCTSCPATKLKSQNTTDFSCLDVCPVNFYAINNTLCSPCWANCTHCNGEG